MAIMVEIVDLALQGEDSIQITEHVVETIIYFW